MLTCDVEIAIEIWGFTYYNEIQAVLGFFFTWLMKLTGKFPLWASDFWKMEKIGHIYQFFSTSH